MDRSTVRGGTEPPYRVCLPRPNVCAGRDDCSGGGPGRFQFGYFARTEQQEKVLENGARQITAFHLAGDFCDLHTYVLKTLPDSVVAMTACDVAIVPSIFRQWIVSIGRRSANVRQAHLFCELYLRFKMVGLTKDMSYLLPATQTDLSDVLGLSLVHPNRTCAILALRPLPGEP